MSRDASTPGEDFKIAAAGPAATALFVLVCLGVDLAIVGPDRLVHAAELDGAVKITPVLLSLSWLLFWNVLLLVFNLIPAFPLDGGRIARAIAWKVTGDRSRATRGAARLGQGFSYLFIVIGIVFFLRGDVINGIWLALIGFILLQSARGAVLQTEFTKRIGGLRVADVMDDEPVAIPQDASVERALDEFFLRYRWPWFPVVDPAQRFLGLIERGAADAVPEVSRRSSTVGDVFEADSTGTLRVPDDAPLETLLGNDALVRLGALMAVDDQGHLRGVVTADQVGRALRRALAGGGGATPQNDPPGV
jgi:CBS domain-containing protein